MRFPLLYNISGAAFLLLFSTIHTSCESDAPPMGEAVTMRDSLPAMVSHGVSKLISDSGVIRYKMITEEWRVYDKTAPPRWEFPKGIYLEKYDDQFKVNLHITADSAWLYEQNLWKLTGHVILDDQEARTHLTTNELYWNMRTGEMASNVHTRLTEPDQEIEGNWFRATILNKRVTRYHVRQSSGFMPMGNLDSDKSQPTPGDTAQATFSPIRPRPESRPKAR